MYASLRFKQSYQWYTNSGDEDRGMIHDNLFWMSTNKIIEMKVLCEQFDPSKFKSSLTSNDPIYPNRPWMTLNKTKFQIPQFNQVIFQTSWFLRNQWSRLSVTVLRVSKKFKLVTTNGFACTCKFFAFWGRIFWNNIKILSAIWKIHLNGTKQRNIAKQSTLIRLTLVQEVECGTHTPKKNKNESDDGWFQR